MMSQNSQVPLSQVLSQRSKLHPISEVAKSETVVSLQKKEEILGEISEYLKDLKTNDKDHFEQLLEISKFIQNSHIDTRKFATLKTQVTQFREGKGRRMSIEELQDYCKTLFQDFKFIDMLVKFLKEEKMSKEHDKEN